MMALMLGYLSRRALRLMSSGCSSDLLPTMMTGDSPPKLLMSLEPVFDAVFVFTGAAVAGEDVEAALGEEELVGGVVDFLATESPRR